MGTVTLLALIAVFQIKKSTTEQAKESLQTLLLTVEQAHQILVRKHRIAIKSLAKNERVITLTQQLLLDHSEGRSLTNNQNMNEVRQMLTPILENFSDQDFFIIAPDNTNIAALTDTYLGINNIISEHKPELLKRVLENQEDVFVPPLKPEFTNNQFQLKQSNEAMAMFIATPIVNAKRQTIAALAFSISPMTYFSKVTTIGRAGRTGETYAFDKDGTLLTESRFIEQLRKLSTLGLTQNTQLNFKIKDPGGDLTKGFKPLKTHDELPLTYMAQKATSGQNGFNVEGYRNYKGIKVIGAWLWNDNFQFGLATEIQREEAYKPFYKTRNTFIAVISITLMLCLAVLNILFRMQKQYQTNILETNAELEIRVAERTADLEATKEELHQLNQELAVLVSTDELTGLYNRRHFDNQFNLEWQRCLRDNKSIGVIIFDIDYFKQYNDGYGHLMGDICLKNIGSMLLEIGITKRPSDIVARYGGEEFIVLLSNTDIDYCQKAAQSICDGVRDLGIPHQYALNKELQVVTVSVGYVVTDELNDLRPNHLIVRADKALYRAKDKGRNRIVKYVASDYDNVTSINEHSPVQ